MQYSVKVSNESRFKFHENPHDIIAEQEEESKANSSVASSLVTEEDSSGNPLPPEIVKIRERNKQLQKDLTTEIMNFKSNSRSLLNSEVSDNEAEKAGSQPKNEEEKLEVMDLVDGNEALKSMCEQIIKLQIDYQAAVKELKLNEKEIFNTENEYIRLKQSLLSIEDELHVFVNNKDAVAGCSCTLI